MQIVNIVQEGLALVEGLLGHFVSVTGSNPALTSDFEWVLPAQSATLEPKGEYLVGAIADIAVYGAVMLDWIVQSMLGTSQFNATT